MEEDPRPDGRFPALRSRDFRLLWMGQTVSAVGSQMQVWTVRFHVYILWRDPLALALLPLSRFIPIVLFSLLGGAVADAHDRRRILFITQTLLAVSALLLAWQTANGSVTVASLYGLNALSAAAISFDNPARQSLVPNLVPRAHYPNAASLNSVAMQVATITGPMLAGIFIASGHLAVVYVVNAISFFAVIVALSQIRAQSIERTTHERTPVTIEALKDGIRFVWQTPILKWSILLDFFATFFSSAEALLPMFTEDILKVGKTGYGFLAAAPAVGSLLAGGIMTLRPPVVREGRVMLLSVAVYGMATIVFGMSPWFWLSWLAFAGTGAADTVSTILRQTIRQLVTPDHLRGRMTASTMLFFMGGPQLGNLEAGLVARWTTAQISVITGGLGCVIAALWIGSRVPLLRRYRGEETS